MVFVELPEVGQVFDANDEIGTIESVKAVAEIFTPVAGEIVEVNEAVVDDPELLNDDPHGEGWLVKIRFSSEADLKRPDGRREVRGLRRERRGVARVEPTEPRSSIPPTAFPRRHLGPSEAETAEMLALLGVGSLEELAEEAVPAAIRLATPLVLSPLPGGDALPGAPGERELLARLRRHGGQEPDLPLLSSAWATTTAWCRRWSSATSSRTPAGTPSTPPTSPRSRRGGWRRC